MPASKKSTGRKITGRDLASGALENGHDRFSQDMLDRKIAEIMKQVPMKFTNGAPVAVRTIGQFLYKIDFIIARKTTEDGTIIRRFFDQSRFLFDQYLDFGFSWEVHPAYRWALQPDTLESAFDQIELEPDA